MTVAKKIFLLIAITTSVFTVSYLVDTGRTMTPEITVPYFSGAAIAEWGCEWRFNLNEVDSFSKLTNLQDKKERINSFLFSNNSLESRNYQINQPGYRYVISIAHFLFPFTGQIGAVKLFQLIMHILISFLIMIKLNIRQRILFYSLYIINPIIIFYSVFPFYYFWQVIPSFILLLVYLNKGLQKYYLILLTSVLLAAVCNIRISVLPICIVTLLLGFNKLEWWKRISGIALFIIVLIFINPPYLSKHPGHVMYCGLGAYPGSNVTAFSDSVSFRDYSRASGKMFDYNSNPGMYDPEIIMGESKWGMEKYFEFAKAKPLVVVRNAALNILESFSFGYYTRSRLITYFSAILGLVFLLLLIKYRMWMEIFFIAASSISYVLYLPPVPIYMYGSYILIAFAVCRMTSKSVS